MKTVIDAVNFYKAEWPKFDWDDFKENCNCIVEALFTGVSDDLPYSSGEISQGGSKCDAEQFAIVCNEAEFNQCVDEMSKAEWIPKAEAKPIYTSAMANHNILPAIGMEYLDEDGQVCVAIGHYSSFVAGVQTEHIIQQYPLISVSRNNECKPLPVPIELIDGEAYSFTHCDEFDIKGVYSLLSNNFSVPNGTCGIDYCTNIKHLT